MAEHWHRTSASAAPADADALPALVLETTNVLYGMFATFSVGSTLEVGV